MANENQNTEEAMHARAQLFEYLQDGQHLYLLKVHRAVGTKDERIIFRNNSELCEAIELLCKALHDAMGNIKVSVNYRNEPAKMEVQMVRI